MIDNRAVGKTIASLRQSRNMTQQQLAAALNVSHQAVSKWENGAALPDVQTLMDLTRLFGITMEQLLNAEVPKDRFEKDAPADDPIQNLGTFFNNLVNGIFQNTGDDKGIDIEVEIEPDEEKDSFDVEKLLQMAPYMSREALDELLLKHRKQLTSDDIAKFAPFISKDCLEKLIQNPDSQISWDNLQKLAPFLKREVVDRLAKLAAEGGRIVQDPNTCENINKAFEDIGRGVEKVVRKVGEVGEGMVNEMVNAYNSFVDSTSGREERTKALRNAAARRALEDDNWDWLALHMEDITDEALLKDIAQKANGLGMHDWVLENMTGYADTRTIDAAIEAGNWSWLGDHVWQFEDDIQEKIALAAARAENWQWLSTYAEQITMENCADQIAVAAYRAGAKVLVLQLVEHCMSPEQRETLANEIVAKDDYDFLDDIARELFPEYFGRLCLARAQDKRWDTVARFADRADHESVEKLMELAIAEGNFDAIDLLNPLL